MIPPTICILTQATQTTFAGACNPSCANNKDVRSTFGLTRKPPKKTCESLPKVAAVCLVQTRDITLKVLPDSGGKVIGAKNTKIRNPYLKWAFGEVILKAQVSEPQIGKLYKRLKSKYGLGRAKSIIAHRFAVATYFMLKNKQAFDVERFVQTSKYK